jgi:hypothetical protein
VCVRLWDASATEPTANVVEIGRRELVLLSEADIVRSCRLASRPGAGSP